MDRILPKKSSYIQKSQLINGFSITPAQNATGKPDRIKIKAAYERAGSVNEKQLFKEHHPSDFNFLETSMYGQPIISMFECSEIARTANTIEVEVHDSSFRIEISGFDKKRDLISDAIAIFD